MNWPSVERLFAAALETPAEGRQALLDSDPDDAVRAEVRRLLARHDALSRGHDSFLATLDLDRAATLVESVEPDDPPVVGRYEIVRRLGSGATGVVYLARDPSLARQVALKLLSPHLSHDATGIRRFTDEARAASRLDHPHIVAVHEIGRSADDRLFIAMAYHEGDTLRDRIARGALPVAEAMRIAGDVADGLSAAHAQGIVHRDIKPENILLTPRGACIVDFGIAKVAGETLTRTGAALGTAAYMSPEQTRGHGGRPSLRSLVARCSALRDAHRPEALSRRRRRGAHLQYPARCGRARHGPAAGPGSGRGTGGGSLSREGAGATVPVGGCRAFRAPRPFAAVAWPRARQAVAARRTGDRRRGRSCRGRPRSWHCRSAPRPGAAGSAQHCPSPAAASRGHRHLSPYRRSIGRVAGGHAVPRCSQRRRLPRRAHQGPLGHTGYPGHIAAVGQDRVRGRRRREGHGPAAWRHRGPRVEPPPKR